jgi:serine/threonine protein kinase/tetratricopeptide (TPR) repeat protein
MSTWNPHANELFLKAIELHSPGERQRFLEGACAGDAGLRAEVEALLQAGDRAGSFLESPAPDLVANVDQAPISEGPGTMIGPYKLLEQIGEGGFGIVFMAEQTRPIRRKVALKVLKPGMDTRQVVARFEAERQALALMDHPNIAKVLDAGQTPSGRPYFVMDLVRGLPITEYCDQARLTPRERLELFVHLCQAVQHAHTKGIIHRDLKPSNVLVTLHDGTPVVKVIDFGIAKALGQQLTDKTLFTGFAQMIGTPPYMSPEQTALSNIDVDTRSDVYALGVLLYELLTGTTPFDKERLQEVGYDEMRRIIREEEPPKPSTRLSTLGQAAATVSMQRRSDPKRLTRLCRGELDWIVMKCLEKDRGRRYQTTNDLALDLQRYLHDERVLACPPSAGYRLRKFVRHNKGPVLAASLIALALVGGIIGTAWGMFRAEVARQDAVRAQQAEAARAKGERRAREEAQASEAETQAVLNFVEKKIFAAARPQDQEGGLSHEVTLRKALESALPDVARSFAGQPLIEARLRLTLGSSFMYLGEFKSAAEQFQAARTIYTRQYGPDHPDTLKSAHLLAGSYYELGRHADALKLHQENLARRKATLGPDHSDTLKSMLNLAVSYYKLGRHADAVKLYEETLALLIAKLGPDDHTTLLCMGNLALSYDVLGRYADALQLRDKALALIKAKLGPYHPDTLWSMMMLANSYESVGRLADALALHEKTLALRKEKLPPDHPDTLWSMSNLARTYAALGRHADALKLRQETLAKRKVKLSPDHPDTLWSMGAVADSLNKLDRGAEAVPIIDECLKRAVGKVVDKRLIPRLGELRLRHFEKRKDAAGCRQTAEIWEQLKRTDADSLYRAACNRAVTAAVIRATDRSEKGAKEAAAEADRAMAWLTQAVAAGYKNLDKLQTDRDLDALRGREDFKKLSTLAPKQK